MGVVLLGNGGVAGEVDGTTYRALRTTPRPTEYGAFGHYKISMLTGSVAAGAGANSELLQLRWVDATRLFVPTLIRVDGIVATTAFASGQLSVFATIARSWSADGTGGNAITLTGDNNAMRTTMGTSLFSTGARIATTAALGTGTKTLDANNIGQLITHTVAPGVNAAPAIQVGAIHGTAGVNLLDPTVGDGEAPPILAQNEGIVVRATVPATGVWIAGITVRWMEVSAY